MKLLIVLLLLTVWVLIPVSMLFICVSLYNYIFTANLAFTFWQYVCGVVLLIIIKSLFAK